MLKRFKHFLKIIILIIAYIHQILVNVSNKDNNFQEMLNLLSITSRFKKKGE